MSTLSISSENKKALIKEYNYAVDDLNMAARRSRNSSDPDELNLYHYCIGYVDALDRIVELLGMKFVKSSDKALDLVKSNT